ncbi:MAG TPA: tetratricopeptide repeat protein [Pyrinomonadaceae bacterium]|nr:tetratricopeptide repeat protein [Pyrinomonadaceae bacterium]
MSDLRDTQAHLISLPSGAAALLIVLLLLLWNTGRSGIGSLLAAYAAKTNHIAAGNSAVRLSPGDADAHYVRGTLLEGIRDLPGAIDEYHKAATARPEDYFLWLQLARARELNGEIDAAIAMARHAVSLAPHYAQPHYQLGNILLRAGRQDEAFKELKLAGASNPTLMPGIIDLAWRLSGGNIQFVEKAIAPENPQAYQTLGQYFRQRNEVDAAIAMYNATGPAGEQDRHNYLAELIAAKRFKQAGILRAADGQSAATSEVIFDPGFEQESNLKEAGFGWRIGDRDQGFQLSLDATSPREGRSSLKVEFTGDFHPSSTVIYQLVLVEPTTHYQLRVSIRAEGVVSGGLPVVEIVDADENQILGQSEQFPNSTSGWGEYTINFNSKSSTSAVRIGLRRQPCEGTPCPIFGRLWLDNFSLRRL